MSPQRVLEALRKPDLLGRALWRLRSAAHLWRLRRAGMVIGKRTTINPWVTIMDPRLVTIGSDCSISGAVFATHSGYDRIASRLLGKRIDTRRPIVIGDRCFVGAGSVIKAGVTIGSDVIVCMGAIVFSDAPAGMVMRGNPAVPVGKTIDYLARLDARATAEKPATRSNVKMPLIVTRA